MKFLKEAYGQSDELDSFVYLSKYRFSTYYKVTINNPESRPNFEERYFAFEDSAREYYNKLLQDVREYGWDRTTVKLIEVKIESTEDDIEEFTQDNEEE